MKNWKQVRVEVRMRLDEHEADGVVENACWSNRCDVGFGISYRVVWLV